MIDNDVLVAAVDAAFSVNYATAYRSGVVSLFYSDGVHRAAVTLEGTTDSEVMAVAGLACALGADQMVWATGAVYSDTMADARMDPDLTPTLAYLAARRDNLVAYYRRALSMLDDGSMRGAAPLVRASTQGSRWAALVVIPWIMDQPEGDLDVHVETLTSRGHKVTLV